MHARTVLISLLAIAGCGDDKKPVPDSGGGPQTARNCPADNGGITLPSGFCATVFADNVGKVRQIAVTPMGRVFAAVENSSETATDAHVLALFDADDDGVAEQSSTFGNFGGNGIAWDNGQLYVAPNDQIVRYAMPDGTSTPQSATPDVIVTGLPATGDHSAKTVVISGSAMYVNIGSPSNVCQIANRALHSLGRNPCPELATRAGVWQFDATMMNQGLAKGTRIGTGMRNTNAMAMDPSSGTAAGAAGGTLWGAINGRDQLNEDWPEMFSAEQDKQLPADEVVAITPGTDRGWPYCYADPAAKQMKLAPEYGGNGTVQGGCAAIPMPPISLAAHSAPLGMTFVTGTQFPEAFRGGVLISNHGTRFDANATGDLHGYDVEFVPFANGQPSGDIQKFATGFDAGARPLPDAAPHRPVGLAMMPDGSLLIGDDQGGRIWRVFYNP